MKPITTLGFGGALFAAALLVACGGGGGGSSTLPSNGSPSNPGGPQAGAMSVRIAIPVAPKRRTHGSRRRDYVSTGVQGLQLVVTAAGANPISKTIYVNVASPSPLCVNSQNSNTPTGTEYVCTVPVPVLATTQTIVATQVDATPVPFVSPSPGYGSGFGANSHILAVGSTTTTATGSAQTVALGMGAIAATMYDCNGYFPASPSPQNFVKDPSGANVRLVVTAGVVSDGIIGMEFDDPGGNWYDALPSPAPGFSPVPQKFVDVNGSPTPITVVSSISGVTVAVLPQTPAPSPSPAASASIPDDSTYWDDCTFFIQVHIAASLGVPAPGATPITVTFNNNLTALIPTPFATSTPNNTYGSTLVYIVAPIGVSPASTSISTGAPATVTGSDYLASSGMSAESAYGLHDGVCAGTASASVLQSGVINPANWQQGFTVTKTGGAMGTCTFYLYDVNTKVITNQVTVTVGP